MQIDNTIINKKLLADKVMSARKIFILNGEKRESIYVYKNNAYKRCIRGELKGIVKSYIPISEVTVELLNNIASLIIYSAPVINDINENPYID